MIIFFLNNRNNNKKDGEWPQAQAKTEETNYLKINKNSSSNGITNNNRDFKGSSPISQPNKAINDKKQQYEDNSKATTIQNQKKGANTYNVIRIFLYFPF